MISDVELAVMKPTAVVINVGCGSVIDEPALLRALTATRIKGAGLDVFEHEPLGGTSAVKARMSCCRRVAGPHVRLADSGDALLFLSNMAGLRRVSR